ncbi:MAG: hypothetical protein WDO12_09375 [Pseudomonadota bacterium]
MRSLDQQIVFLQAQLAQLSKASPVYASTGERIMAPADRLKYLQAEYARASARYGADWPDVVSMKREMDGLATQVSATGTDNERQRQLQDAQTQLATARQRYGAEYPDVKTLERLVAKLSEPVANNTAAGTAPKQDEPDNPAYIQLQSQLEAANSERTSLLRKRDDLVDNVAKLEGRLASAPGVEKDFMTLARELDSTQVKYREVRQKQMEAQLAQNLEAERKGERFTLIDPPVAPEEPASPNRHLILVLASCWHWHWRSASRCCWK